MGRPKVESYKPQLTEIQRGRLRRAYEQGVSLIDLQTRFNLSQAAIHAELRLAGINHVEGQARRIPSNKHLRREPGDRYTQQEQDAMAAQARRRAANNNHVVFGNALWTSISAISDFRRGWTGVGSEIG